jgi:uncharacterized protein
MQVTALHTYPVKGCHRNDHDVARVEPWGLAGDRRWMMVDPDGVGITQRIDPRLTQLRVRGRDGGLTLSAPGLSDLDVDEPVDGPEELVRVFTSHARTPARVADTEWSSAFFGRPVRLVWQAEAGSRTIAGVDEPGEPVSFADGYPILLANEASLTALNDWLDDPVPMTRFRPNLVVGGASPWAEDKWTRLRIGDLELIVDSGCPRCLVTTIDQETGEKGREPLRALGRHRRFGQSLLFAVNLVPAPGFTGSLRVGDAVTVLD